VPTFRNLPVAALITLGFVCLTGQGGLSDTKEIAEHIVRQLTTSFNDDAYRHKATDSYTKRTTEFVRDYFFIIPLRPLRKPLRSLRLRLYCKGHEGDTKIARNFFKWRNRTMRISFGSDKGSAGGLVLAVLGKLFSFVEHGLKE
jgi:hypothetical protein